MKFLSTIFICASLVWANFANAESCAINGNGSPSGLLHSLYLSVVNSNETQEVHCSSLVGVWNKVSQRTQTGGRRLEPEKPFNQNEAQANVAAALRDPEINKRLQQLRRDVKDENLRLLYEAAIFDEEGYYGARELRILEIQQRVK